MGTVSHSAIGDANLHQPKGISAATAGAIIVANGAGGSATTDNASTPVNLYDNELRRPEIKDYSEAVNDIGNTGTAATIDIENGNVVTATLTGNCTFTFSNPPASGNAGSFTLILTQDGTGSRTVTWPDSVDWDSGTTPTLSSGAADVDVLTFLTTDGGTTWLGFVAGNNMS